MNKEEYLKIRHLKSFSSYSIVQFLCYKLLTPIMTPYFITKGKSPNYVTFLMIITGVLSSLILFIPNIWCKLLCSIVFFIWFGFDCSDGEVARFSQTFSTYGQKLDWMAHLSCHPLFVIGMSVSIMQFYPNINMLLLCLLSMFLIGAELVHRNVVAMTEKTPLSKTNRDINKMGDNVESQKRTFLQYVKTQLAYFPNIVVFAPLLLFVDVYFSLGGFCYVYMFWIVIYLCFVVKEFVYVCYLMYIE